MFDYEKSFENWFARIIIHGSSDYYRYSKQDSLDIDAYSYGLPVEGPDIIDQLSYDEILSCVSKLSPQYRAVFNLYIIDGYKHREISDILKISEGTSKSNLSKAKNQLQMIIGEKYGIKQGSS